MGNFILVDENAVFYECGYSCDNEIYLKTKDKAFFITDARYAIEARELIKDAEVIEAQKPLIKEARALLKKLDVKSLVFDPHDFSYAQFSELSKFSYINFKQKPFFSKKKRIIKSENEIKMLQKAAKLGAKCFNELASYLQIQNGSMSEEAIFYHASQIFTQQGALSLSFSPITAINENAAKAHALPSQKKLKSGDLFLLDAGVKFKRYCSDRTRTACFWENFNFTKEQNFKDAKQNEIYQIVNEAQQIAIKSVKPGMMAKDIDKAARSFIAKAGYEKEFFHSTGHGLGIDIHELPNINSKDETILKPGMVFSVEPGIYIENEFGVRIEDVVVVTEDGCEIL